VDPRLGRKAGEPPVGLPALAYVAAALADSCVTREICGGDPGELLVMAATSSDCDTSDSVHRIRRTEP